LLFVITAWGVVGSVGGAVFGSHGVLVFSTSDLI